jgi:Magnesium chelatase, subunit ChlI
MLPYTTFDKNSIENGTTTYYLRSSVLGGQIVAELNSAGAFTRGLFRPLLPHGKRATQGCPCGFWNDPTRECRCSPPQIQRYVGRISGPLLDRIDIHIDVPAVKFRELTGDAPPETDSSTTIRDRVIAARERQLRRFTGERVSGTKYLLKV